MAIQRLEEVPAICKNKECENYNVFELVDTDIILRDSDGVDYLYCPECGIKIIIK